MFVAELARVQTTPRCYRNSGEFRYGLVESPLKPGQEASVPVRTSAGGRINASAQEDSVATKLRGGYYTPQALADWMCAWAIRHATDRVLEPSSGDGVFVEAAIGTLAALGCPPSASIGRVTAIEIARSEAKKSRSRIARYGDPGGSVVCSDFFDWNRSQRNAGARFDCVVGNPPFIRYQNFPEPARSHAMSMMVDRGLRPNRLTNVWVPFVVGAMTRLLEGGRMAMVLPAELLQVTYAAQLRQFMADHFHRIHIFACNRLFFDAEQEVVVLLADGYSREAVPGNECLIELVEANSVDEILGAQPNHKAAGEYSIVNHTTEKWLKYFLSPKEIDFMRSLKGRPEITSLSAHAEIDVGVVTGRNEFFVLDQKTVEAYGLGADVSRLVGRSSHLRGSILHSQEWRAFARGRERVYLLTLAAETKNALANGAKRYVRIGEKSGFHTGFKCSIREPWWTVPSVWVPDSFFFRQIYDFPRVVINQAGATSTDTIHRMRCKGDAAAVAANLYTHLTAASAEIEGRSYGGGVLELEPTEAECLLVPAQLQSGLPIDEVDAFVRDGRLKDVLAENDRLILQSVGLTRGDCAMLRAIWQKMRDRRINRRKPKG
jgi:adenine-specific DNA methylase